MQAQVPPLPCDGFSPGSVFSLPSLTQAPVKARVGGGGQLVPGPTVPAPASNTDLVEGAVERWWPGSEGFCCSSCKPRVRAAGPGCSLPSQEASKKVGRVGGRREGRGEGLPWGRLTWTAPWFVWEPCLGNEDHPGD